MKNQFKLFEQRNFLPLFITQFLGACNDNIFKNAIVVLITYRLSQSAQTSQLTVTLAFAIFVLPFFLFSATAGELSDHFNKAKLIRIIKFAEILIMLLATVGFYHQSQWLLLSTLFLMGTHSTFFGPLKYAILPEHLPKHSLISGNALIEAGTFLAILVGTLIGSTLVLGSAGVNVIVVLLLSIAMLGWVSSLFIPNTKSFDTALSLNWNFVTESIKIIQHARTNRDVFLSILGISWFWLVGAVFLAQFPNFTRDILSANADVFALFILSFSMGIAVGSLLCNRLLDAEVNAKYVPLSILLMSVFIFDLYFVSLHPHIKANGHLVDVSYFLGSFRHWRILIDIFMISCCGGVYVVPLYALMQHAAKETHRARALACNNIINALFMVVSAIICLILLSLHFTISQLFAILGVANIIVAAYICKILPYAIIQTCIKALVKMLWQVEVHGMDNYVKAGKRVLIIANHTSFLDAIIISAFIPNKLTFAINSQIASKWWIKPILMLFDAFLIDPTNPMATKSLIRLIQGDCRCLIFPEGRITVTGALMKIYEGPGLIADKANAVLLPIRIDGAQYTPFSRLRGKVKRQWFPKITLTILPSFKLDLPEEMNARDRRQRISSLLYDMMIAMMFESSNLNVTLFESLLEARRIHGGSRKIIEDINRKPLNYNQLIMRVLLLGSYFQKQHPQDKPVGVLLPNTNACIAVFLALSSCDRPPAMLNFTAGSNALIHACKTAEITTIYTSSTFVEAAELTALITHLKEAGLNLVYLEDLKNKLGLIPKLTAIIKSHFIHSHLHKFFNYFYYKMNSNARPDPERADKPAVYLFTSGSEGNPKGVVLSHKNIQANRYQIGASIDLTPRDVAFNSLPLFHAFGLTGGLFLPILNGVQVFSYPSPLHYRIIPELCYDCNATILFGTDTFLSGYAKYAHPYDFYSLRYVFAGAEKLKPDTRRIWTEKFGIRIFEGYGATETAPILAVNTPMKNKMESVGRLLPKIDHRLEPVPGIEAGGRLFVKGPNIMLGYLDPEHLGQINPPEQGWYDTGDVVNIDEEGFITIKDRVKRFAKVGGEMVSLTAVEYQLGELWPNFNHAVTNIPDPKKGEQLILFTNYPDANRDEIVKLFKKSGLTELSIPKQLFILDEIPLLGSGKVDHVSVKRLAYERLGVDK